MYAKRRKYKRLGQFWHYNCHRILKYCREETNVLGIPGNLHIFVKNKLQKDGIFQGSMEIYESAEKVLAYTFDHYFGILWFPYRDEQW